MADEDLRRGRGGVPRTLEITLDLEDLGPAVGEEQLGELLRATFTDATGTTERTVFVPEVSRRSRESGEPDEEG